MIYSYLKDVALTTVRMDAALYTSIWNGCHLSVRLRYLAFVEKIGYRKGVPCSVKNGTWKGKELDLEAEPPRTNLCWVPTRASNPFLVPMHRHFVSNHFGNHICFTISYRLQIANDNLSEFFFSIVQLWKTHSSSLSLFILTCTYPCHSFIYS